MTATTNAQLLIVDDEPFNIEILVGIFEDDYDIIIAVDGTQVIDLARSTRPDLILLDVMMPGMSGYEVCARLKQDPDTNEIPVIFISGLGEEQAEAQGLDAGAADYVTKPISPGIVRRRVSKQIALKKAYDEIKRSLSLLNATLEATTDAILAVGLDGIWNLYNQQFIDLWQITKEIIATKDDGAALSYVLNQLEDADNFLRKVHELYTTPNAKSFDTLKFKDGRIVERFSMPQYIDGKVVGRVWSFRDVTARKAMEEQVHQLAFYDTLTKLPNRRLLNDRLDQAMASSKRTGLYGALMFLDLDNFKPLNDTHGHVVGDLLLIEVSNRLKATVRETDTVARFGGDEFVVVLSGLDADRAESAAKTCLIADKIRVALAEPYLLTIREEGEVLRTIRHHCTSSIGAALFINQETSQKDILNRADIAMYQAKELGRNRAVVYPEENHQAWSDNQNSMILRLTWHESYKCGEPTIDLEHFELFRLANLLIESAFTREDDPDKFGDALEKLFSNIVRHFADEEAILAQHHYLGLDAHTHAHQVLIAHALQLRDSAAAGGVGIGKLVEFLAEEVVAQHLLREDRKFYLLLKNGVA
ncbi:two-component system, cell cycle response regulator [Gammaproteobacteria bacterium]